MRVWIMAVLAFAGTAGLLGADEITVRELICREDSNEVGPDDELYLLIGGVVKSGNEYKKFHFRLPDQGHWDMRPGRKKLDLSVWKGKLAEGDFVIANVVVMEEDSGGELGAQRRKAAVMAEEIYKDVMAKKEAGVLASDGGEVEAVVRVLGALYNHFSKNPDDWIGSCTTRMWKKDGKLHSKCERGPGEGRDDGLAKDCPHTRLFHLTETGVYSLHMRLR